MMRESTLKALMSDLTQATVLGLGHGARGVMRCGLTLEVPEFQIQASIVVDWGLMIVLDVERQRSHLCRACKTLCQFSRSSPGEFLPQYTSSGILDMISAWWTDWELDVTWQPGRWMTV